MDAIAFAESLIRWLALLIIILAAMIIFKRPIEGVFSALKEKILLLIKAKHGDSEIIFDTSEKIRSLQIEVKKERSIPNEIIEELKKTKQELAFCDRELAEKAVELGLNGSLLASQLLSEFRKYMTKRSYMEFHKLITIVLEVTIDQLKTFHPEVEKIPYYEKRLSKHKSSSV